MRTYRRTELNPTSIAKRISSVLGEPTVDEVARRTGFLKRKREITPLALVVACLSSLAVGGTRWLADIQRTLNRFAGTAVQYKPFHNQLAKDSFPEFFRQLLEQALAAFALPVLQAVGESTLSRFEDIIIHDGSSMALKDCLANVWPGRFTRVSPAAIELHLTMSALRDNAVSVVLAADKEAERQFAPEARELRNRLVLEDRGYESRSMMREIHDHGAFFIIRGKKNIRPMIQRAWDVHGRLLRRLQGKPLSWDVLSHTGVDLDIVWGSGSDCYMGRIVVFVSRDGRNRNQFTYLHTNLPRDEFPAEEVGKLYRLRWQIELLFKEWKSYGNLHRFDTSKPAIAEGLVWASLLGAMLKRFVTHAAERILGVELSTQRVAAASRHFLDQLLQALLGTCGSLLRDRLQEAFLYMRDNTRRAHPKRDREKGRLASGLRHIATA